MAEAEIKRVNFFDGQFLKQGEFLDLDAYHLHMRRRWGFVLFDKSGVVQATASDLAVEVVDVATKRIRVRAGMAIGMRPDLAEAREVVLREDTLPIDLTTQVPALAAGDTAIVTINYDEQGVAIPPSEGDVPGNTRVLEQAVISIHRNALPGPNAANGEPFIRLADVAFNTVTVDTSQRQSSYVKAMLLAPTPAISINPAAIPATGTTPIVVTASGGLNLSTATNASVAIAPSTNLSGIAVSNQVAGSMTVNVTSTAALAGPRTFTVTIGAMSAGATLTVQPAPPPLPTITSVQNPVTRNATMSIIGTNFIAPITVTFTGGGLGVAPVVSLGNTRIDVGVPGAGASNGPITVTAAGGSVPTPFVIVN